MLTSVRIIYVIRILSNRMWYNAGIRTTILLRKGYRMQYEYKAEKDREARLKSEELMGHLPYYVRTYVAGREARMSSRTRLIYISRIDTFFDYLIRTQKFVRYGGYAMDKAGITLNDLDTLTLEDIEAFASWIRSRRITAHPGKAMDSEKETTVNNYLSALSTFFRYFESHGKITKNPVAGYERKRLTKHPVVRLNTRQKSEFLDNVQSGEALSEHQKAYHTKNALRDYAICLTLTRTGLRVSELVGLNVQDMDLDDCFFYVLRKGGKEDRVFFDDETASVLTDYLEYRKTLLVDPTEQALFLNTFGKYKGTRLSVRSVEKLVKKYATTGAPSTRGKITPHKLRATYATDMLMATHDISLVQKSLNHESPQTTMIYADQRTIDLEKARNVLKDSEKK